VIFALAAGSIAGVSSPAAVAAPPSVTTPAPATAALLPGLAALPGGADFLAGVGLPAGAADGRKEVKRLKAALLTAGDLPAGYQRTEKPTVFQGNLLAVKPGAAAAPCDIALDLSTMSGQTKPVAAPVPGHTAMVTLARQDTDPIVLEILSIGAPAAPRAFVEAFADQIRRCPKITLGIAGSADKMVFTVSPLPMPQLGDASAAGTLVIRMKGLDTPVHLKMIAVAKGRATGLVAVVGAEADLAGVPEIAQAAVRRLRGLG